MNPLSSCEGDGDGLDKSPTESRAASPTQPYIGHHKENASGDDPRTPGVRLWKGSSRPYSTPRQPFRSLSRTDRGIVGRKAHSSGIVLVWPWCSTGMTSKLVHLSEGVSGLAEAILDVVAHPTIMCDNAAKVHVGELLGGWKVFSIHFDWCGMLYIQHHDFCLLLADLQAYKGAETGCLLLHVLMGVWCQR